MLNIFFIKKLEPNPFTPKAVVRAINANVAWDLYEEKYREFPVLSEYKKEDFMIINILGPSEDVHEVS